MTIVDRLQPRFYLTATVCVATVSILAVLPMIVYGIPIGNDWSQHLQFAATIQRSLLASEMIPGFNTLSNGGLGDAGIRFYPPLTSYVIGTFAWMLNSWPWAFVVSYFLVFFVGSVGIFFWVSNTLSSRSAISAAIVYPLLPYHLNQVYNNALIAEFFATAVLPFCFLFAWRSVSRSSVGSFVGLTISIAALILTHIPLTVIGLPTVFLYTIVLAFREDLFGTMVRVAGSYSVAILATSFFWTRWIGEPTWLRLASDRFAGATWDYSHNFLLRISNFSGADENSLNLWLAELMLIVPIVGVAASLFILGRKTLADSNAIRAKFAMFAIAAFFATWLSTPIWMFLSTLQKIQFPWRWLSIVNVFAAALIGIGLAKFLAIGNERISPSVAAFCLSILMLVFLSVIILRGPSYLPFDEVTRHAETVTTADSCDCWLPVWVTGEMSQVKRSSKEISSELISASSGGLIRTYSIGENREGEVVLPLFYYPHWRISSAGRSFGSRPDAHGFLSFDSDGHSSIVTVEFVEPQLVRIAYFVSAATWGVFLLTIVVFAFWRFGRNFKTT